jgi:hypothetical protein
MFGGRGANASLNNGFDRLNLPGIQVEGFDRPHTEEGQIEIPVMDNDRCEIEEPPTPMKPPRKKNKLNSQTKQVKEFLNMFKEDHFEPLEEDYMENLDTVMPQAEKTESLFKRIDSWLNSKGVTVCNPESKKFNFYERKRSIVIHRLSSNSSPINFLKQGLKSDSTEDSEVSAKPTLERQTNLRVRLADSVGSIPEIDIIGEFSRLSALSCSLPVLGKKLSLSLHADLEAEEFLESSPNYEDSQQHYPVLIQHKNSLDLSLSNFQ